MRWTLILILLAAVPFVTAAEPWGCCIPPADECFAGDGFATETAFTDACDAGGGTVQGAGSATSCSAFAECTVGCCCAGPSVFNSPTINSTEAELRITQNACTLKTGEYYFNQLPSGGNCVSVCGGVAPGDGGTYTVSGTVVNASDDQPLADAEVFIPYPGGQVTTTSAADGSYTLTDVPELQSSIFALHQACQPGQSSPVVINQDLSDVTVELQCEDVACEHDSPRFVSYPASVPGTDEIEFTMEIDNNCNDIIGFEPSRCDKNFQNCQAMPATVSPAITDRDLEPGTTYCYAVRARFSDGSTTTTGQDSQACITTGDARCLSATAVEWCGVQDGEEAILSCDENNQVEAELCGTLTCSERSGSPECVPVPPCDLCNGLLGFFGHLDFEISPDGLLMSACSNACLLDSELSGRDLMVDAYKACIGVNECTGYNTRDACETDLCGVQDCSWVPINEELGQGICVSDDSPSCESCNDLGGYCNKQTCEAISPDCYYDDQRNGLSYTVGCVDKSGMACRYYDNRTDCAGGAAWDIQWQDGERTGGTNEQTSASQDRLGIGACSWNGNFCIKDADMQTDGETDCIENGRIYTDPFCLLDSEPPNTTFYLSTATDPPVYNRLAVRTLPRSVRDDHAPPDSIKTYVCFDTTGTCYPTETFGTVQLPTAGTYYMRYYSKDPSENSEEVKQLEIVIEDTSNPGLEVVTIEEDT